jgi:hypothetical protein
MTNPLESWGDRKLDNAIKRGHAAAGAHMKNYEGQAIRTGFLLIERKRRLKHGEWLPWLAENFDGHRSTAHRYIELAEANVASLRHLFDAPRAQEQAPPPGFQHVEVDPEEMERAIREAAETRRETPRVSPPPQVEEPTLRLVQEDSYTAVVAAIDSLARARGALIAEGRQDLAEVIAEAHRKARRFAMGLHAAGASYA